ncbi:MAG: AbrB/MazE/SpoVT family DNA-binding domain-containing protein [Candidatus Daviesbacteria bacterium]|nr:AbrB/MazE/SpoVT family DNA-binding domain-containing protein [Candidatus Daviesbacteria bacterium]
MTYTVSITSQGQISIPAKFRKEMGLNKGGKVILSKESDRLILEPVVDFLSLKGSLKSNKKPLSNKELDEFVAKTVAKEYAQKLK